MRLVKWGEITRMNMTGSKSRGSVCYCLSLTHTSNQSESEQLYAALKSSCYHALMIQSLFRKANLEMDNLFDWFCANRLSLSPQKTKYIIIKTPGAKFDLTGKRNDVPSLTGI